LIQYLADQKPELKLAPAQGTWERYKLIEMVNHIATDFHKSIGMLFNPALPPEMRETITNAVHNRLRLINESLKNQQYLLASGFSVADIYFFVVMGWAERTKVDLSQFPQILGLIERVKTRPAVQKTLTAEA